GNMGCVPASEPFMRALRSLTTQDGAILIFDEVMTGFRLSLAGAQGIYDVTPDMTTLGKIVGGGMPLGAYGGRAEIMDNVLPAGKVFQAGTLSGNPVAVAAGNATLKILKDNPPYEQLERQGQRLAEGLRSAIDQAGIPGVVQRVGSMMTLFFQDETHAGPVNNWADADRCNRQRFAEYFWGLIRQGIYMPCSQFEALFFGRHHGDNEIEQTIAAAKVVCRQMVS
ncbi:MAG: aminotransferase class III-fold pyridoxal phosphate-dependent enzyme, partial [Planctomycetota bacterium]